MEGNSEGDQCGGARERMERVMAIAMTSTIVLVLTVATDGGL